MVIVQYRQDAYDLLEWNIDGWVYQYGDLNHQHLSSYWLLGKLSRTHSWRAPAINDGVGKYYQYTPRFPSPLYKHK